MRKAATSLAIALMAVVNCAGAASADSSRGHHRGPGATASPPARTDRTTAAARVNRTLPGQTVPAPPRLAVTGASLLWPGASTPLWSVHGNAELPIASTTKLMTALVVLQHVHDLNTVFTQNDWRPAPVDSQIGLAPGERMTVHDLLVALLLPSGDDAAEDLAYNVGGGSIARFVSMMNADARELGLRRTHYTTPIGLDSPGNYSSPDDLVRLAAYVMRTWGFFRRTVDLPTAVLTSGNYVRHVTNTDDLLGEVHWIHGVKTGHTHRAGYVLVSEGRRDGFTLFDAVLGTDTVEQRDEAALALLRWGFAAFHVVTPVRRGQRLASRPVPYEAGPAGIVAAHGYRAVAPRNARIGLRIGHLRRLHGPMAKGTVVGRLRITVSGLRAVSIPLVLSRRLPAVSLAKKIGHFLKQPFTLLVLALLIVGGIAVIARSRRRPQTVTLHRVKKR